MISLGQPFIQEQVMQASAGLAVAVCVLLITVVTSHGQGIAILK